MAWLVSGGKVFGYTPIDVGLELGYHFVVFVESGDERVEK
jgi:hypothetical protein